MLLQDGGDLGVAQPVGFGLDHAHGADAVVHLGTQVREVVPDGVQTDGQDGVVYAALHQGLDPAGGEGFGRFDQDGFCVEIELGNVGQRIVHVVVQEGQFGKGVAVRLDVRPEADDVF